MMRSVLVFAAIVAAGCHRRPADAPASSSPAAAAVAVRLERGPCFGRCPEYAVDLLTDGTVRFEGRRNVRTVGAQRGTITAAEVRALQQRFTDAGFARADTAYTDGTSGCGRFLPDGPRTVLAARVGTALKVVPFDAGCTDAPRYLQQLATEVDRVARTAVWITGSGGSQ